MLRSSRRCRRRTAWLRCPPTCVASCRSRGSHRGSPRAASSSGARRPPPPTGDPATDEAYARGRAESFRDGGMWLARELAYLGRPWGFELADVHAPVTLWWGERDTVCPPPIARIVRAAPAERDAAPDRRHAPDPLHPLARTARRRVPFRHVRGLTPAVARQDMSRGQSPVHVVFGRVRGLSPAAVRSATSGV